jgi:hypothetical protein
MSWVGWVIAVGGPLLGIGAVMALAMLHEHGARLKRLPVSVSPPLPLRRSCTTLLDDYLVDDREASPAARRRESSQLLLQAQRASTTALEDFLEERDTGYAPAPPAAPPSTRAPAPVVRRRAPVYERAARPTRLVPLTPEIAIV